MPYRKMKIAVGVFVATLILALGGIFYIVLEKKGTFEEKYRFHFISKSAESFNVGMPLHFSGFEIGRIVHIELNEEALVKITFEVSEKNRKWVCEDSLLLLTKPLIGSAKVEILTSLAYPQLKPDEKIAIIFLDSIDDVISNAKPLLDEIQAIMVSINLITSELARKDGSLFQTLDNIERLSENLANSPSLLNTMTGDDQSTILIKDTLGESKIAMQQINLMLQTVQKNVLIPSGDSMRAVNMILEDIRLKLKNLDHLVGETGKMDKDIVQIKESIQFSIEKSNQLMEKIDAIISSSDNEEVQLP